MIRKGHGTDFYETREAAARNAQVRAPVAAFSKDKKMSFVERVSTKNKNPGAGEYKTEKAYTMITSSPMMKRRC